MTLNGSFLTSCKENLKRRIWVVLLISLYYFITYIIVPVIQINQIDQDSNLETLLNAQNMFHEYMSLSPILLLMTAVFGVILALQGYSYLFNRRKIDMYLSVPVSSKKRFFVIQTTSILTFVFFHLAFGSLGLLIGNIERLTTLFCIVDFYASFFIYFSIFMAVFELTTVAIMLTGNTIVSILAVFVLGAYEFFIRIIHNNYVNYFFDHFVMQENGLFITVPIYPFLRIFDDMYYQYSSSAYFQLSLIKYIIWILAYAFIFLGLAFFLYSIRPNEATERSISFPKTKPWISIFIQIIVSLAGGLFFYNLTNDKLWIALFGIVFTAFITYAALNIIFEYDVRSMFRMWYTLIISVSISFLYFSCIYFDILNVDSFIPELNQVESCSINSSYFQQIGSGSDRYYYNYSDDPEDFEDSIWTSNVQPYIDLASNALGFEDNYDSIISDFYSDGLSLYSTEITFHLKNGRDVRRRYQIEYSESNEELKAIIDNAEYKDSIRNSVQQKIETTISPILYFSNGTYDIHVESEKISQILDAYFKDLEFYTYENNVLQTPVCEWSIEVREEANFMKLPIYQNFTNTLTLLESYGLDQDIHLNSSQVSRVQFFLYDQNYENEHSFQITDSEELDILLPNVYSSSLDYTFYERASRIENNSSLYYVDIYVYPNTGIPYEDDIMRGSFTYYGELPSFISSYIH